MIMAHSAGAPRQLGQKKMTTVIQIAWNASRILIPVNHIDELGRFLDWRPGWFWQESHGTSLGPAAAAARCAG